MEHGSEAYLPGSHVDAGQGPDHRAQCLEALALYGL